MASDFVARIHSAAEKPRLDKKQLLAARLQLFQCEPPVLFPLPSCSSHALSTALLPHVCVCSFLLRWILTSPAPSWCPPSWTRASLSSPVLPTWKCSSTLPSPPLPPPPPHASLGLPSSRPCRRDGWGCPATQCSHPMMISER